MPSSPPQLVGARPPSPLAAAGVFLGIALIALVATLPATLWGRRAALVGVYERAAVLRGEVWRLVTAYFVHLDPRHLAWNLLALGVVALLFAGELPARTWLVVTLVTCVGASVALLLFSPRVVAMAGLSGLLHGLLAAGALAAAKARRWTGFLALALLTAKLVAEAVHGPMPWTAGLLGPGVATQAHLYGALAGLVAVAPALRRRQAT
ncbi:MAG: rhombosortase [Acidobacteria bacterium]|nr:rhombosortase [Acidobacteriota bacterium]